MAMQESVLLSRKLNTKNLERMGLLISSLSLNGLEKTVLATFL